MFKVSDLVVYPGYGVARISREIKKDFNNHVESFFYELKFLAKDITVLVPKEGIDCVGIRYLSTEEDLLKVFDIFCEKFDSDWFFNTTLISWNRRSKDYQNRIREGKFLDLAKIYRDIKYMETFKSLSFGEKGILCQVDALLSEECAIIQGRVKEVVSQELSLCCTECISGRGNTMKNFLTFDMKRFLRENF